MNNEVEAILFAIGNMRIAVIGDMCLDAYWHSDMKLSELSRETPHYPLPVIREEYYPGGGANVVACVHALKATVLPIAVWVKTGVA